MTQKYNRREVPRTYDAGWVATELGNIQRALYYPSSRTVDGNHTASSTNDDLILANAFAGPITVTLPTPRESPTMRVTIKKIDASANAVTISGTIDGVVNPTLATQYKSMTVQSNGTAWYTLATI